MMRTLRRGGFELPIISNWKRWFLLSGALMAVCAGSLAVRKVNLGLEFRGGTAIQVQAAKPATVEGLRKALGELRITDAVVQRVGERGFLVQTHHLGAELQRTAAEQVARVAGVAASDVNVTDVGPKWGREITSKMTRALIVFLIVAMIYISIRFEPKMAVAAIVALFHDLLATAGIYSLSGFVVTPATVIALLTILGYSLYDTVIIFDRVKERTATLSAAGRVTYSEVVNQSLNQVLVRSLNTSLTSLLPVGSLLFIGSFLLGADTLRELALALLVGIGVGTYSSIFIAPEVLALWKEREPRWAALRARIGARAAEPARRVEAPLQPARAEAAGAVVASRPAGGGPGGRPPQRRRKRKRRR